MVGQEEAQQEFEHECVRKIQAIRYGQETKVVKVPLKEKIVINSLYSKDQRSLKVNSKEESLPKVIIRQYSSIAFLQCFK